MFNPYTKLGVSMTTCNEDVKSTAKNVKFLVLSHPLGEIGVTYMLRLWLVGQRVVDFLLVL